MKIRGTDLSGEWCYQIKLYNLQSYLWFHVCHDYIWVGYDMSKGLWIISPKSNSRQNSEPKMNLKWPKQENKLLYFKKIIRTIKVLTTFRILTTFRQRSEIVKEKTFPFKELHWKRFLPVLNLYYSGFLQKFKKGLKLLWRHKSRMKI